MAVSIDTAAVARGTRHFFRLLTPQQVEKVCHLERDADLESRIAELAERANEGELKIEEESEYRGYVEANSVLALLRDAARHQVPSR